MRYAIISVSAEGARLGLRLKATLKGDITLYEHQECASGAEANYFKKTAALTSEIFGRYDGLIYIMAAGIVVPCFVWMNVVSIVSPYYPDIWGEPIS